jgi:hypothetical protein
MRRLINTGLCVLGMINSVSLYAAPTGPCLGHLFDGTPFFKDDQGGFCTVSGQMVRNVNGDWLKGVILPHAGGEVTLYCGEYNEVLDEQLEQLPIIGYHRTDKTPVFLLQRNAPAANDLCAFGNPLPNQTATRGTLAPDVIFTDGRGPIELPVHPDLGQAVGHMKVLDRGKCVPIFRTPQGRFVTENGCAVVYVNGTYLRELVPGILLLDTSSALMYDDNGRGPLRDQIVNSVGDNHALYQCGNIYYAYIENRIEVYGTLEGKRVLSRCELAY